MPGDQSGQKNHNRKMTTVHFGNVFNQCVMQLIHQLITITPTTNYKHDTM